MQGMADGFGILRQEAEIIMREKTLEILKNAKEWKAPEVSADIPHGDMPGDKVEIGEEHIRKSQIIMQELIRLLPEYIEKNGKVVIAVCGGSGVGKSENASLISYYLNEMGIGAYTMSGDNYPRRIPMYNDAERLQTFRLHGVRALVKNDLLDEKVREELRGLQKKDDDANTAYSKEYPWFQTYLDGALAGLRGYLGTRAEIDFDEVSEIISQFKSGKEKIFLKRMGRTPEELWYEKVNFSKIDVLVVEWTHGNSDFITGVDIPVFLNSTPEETMAHRAARNRDGKVDSAFTTRVLEIEQAMLAAQAHKAKVILSKQGELLSYEQYQEL